MALTSKTCVPCQGGIPALTAQEAATLLKQTPGWELNSESTQIKRNFKFENFVQALEFVNKVGESAEAEGHHPDIAFGWGYANVVFYTHKIKGLHENDFIMAAKVSEIAA